MSAVAHLRNQHAGFGAAIRNKARKKAGAGAVTCSLFGSGRVMAFSIVLCPPSLTALQTTARERVDGAHRELLRHANIQTTMNIYTQAVSDQKRAAKVVEMVLNRAPGAGSREDHLKGSLLGADSQSATSRQLASSD